MNHISKVLIRPGHLIETVTALQKYGGQECEGLVLWLGSILGESCSVEKILIPPQQAIKSEEGVGYFVTSETLFNLNKLLSATGLRLLAQVHSHPGKAYHSHADDRYCIVTTEGGFSVVVPDFGFGPLAPQKWAIYRLSRGKWQKLQPLSVKEIFSFGNEKEEIEATSIAKKICNWFT